MPTTIEKGDVKAALDALGPSLLLQRLGITARGNGTRTRGTCPLCEAKDKLVASIGNGVVWYCHKCKASGDSLALVAASEGLSLKQFPLVLERAQQVVSVVGAAPRRHLEPPSEPMPEHLPERDVEALWERCAPLTGITVESSYLMGRGTNPSQVADRDLARILPPNGLPRWASHYSNTHRLVVPTYDCTGAMRGLRGWRVKGRSKAKRMGPQAATRGGTTPSAKGLALADALGRETLRTGAIPSWWSRHKQFEVIVVEGEPDLLSVACEYSDANEEAPAVLGIPGQGTWTEGLSARLPSGALVRLQTHNDDAGRTYAEDIGNAVKERCDVVLELRENE